MWIHIVVFVTIGLALSATVILSLISLYVPNRGQSNRCHLSVAPMITLRTGAGPMAIRAADLNHDSFVDLIVGNHDIGTTSIFLGYGNGSFKDRIDLLNGPNAGTNSIDIGDVNGDHHLDIVVVNRNAGNVGIFFGNGDGNFTSQMTFSTGNGSSPAKLTLHDLNNDMNLDLVISDHVNNRLFVYLGNGNGTFSIRQTLQTGNNSGPYEVIVNDFNRDHQMDIAVGSGDGNMLGIFHGDGTGYFSQQESYKIPGGPYALVAGDFNLDGRLDIVTANYDSNDTSVLLATAENGFHEVYRFSTGNGSLPYAIAMGDFNEDRFQDLIFANSGTDNVAVLLGNPAGQFRQIQTFSTGVGSSPTDITVADLNGDHRLDFISANNGAGTISIFLNTCSK